MRSIDINWMEGRAGKKPTNAPRDDDRDLSLKAAQNPRLVTSLEEFLTLSKPNLAKSKASMPQKVAIDQKTRPPSGLYNLKSKSFEIITKQLASLANFPKNST